MSAITAKEKNMLMVTIVLVLYAVAFFCYKGQKLKWKKAKQKYMMDRETYLAECDLIAGKEKWESRYKAMCSLMPVFPYNKDVDTHWLNIMDTVASEKKLVITRRQTGKEEEAGDVYELPIECKNWEGTLDSLVGFLYGLREEGAMLDVRQIYIRPASPGYLKGTFTLYCAYMRGDVVEDDSAPAAALPSPAPAMQVSADVKTSPKAPAVKSTIKPVPPEKGPEEVSPEKSVDEEEAVRAALEALKKEAG